MTFNGNNVDEVKAFAGDACEIKPVFDNNGVVWGQEVIVKTTILPVTLIPYDVIVKDDNGVHVMRMCTL